LEYAGLVTVVIVRSGRRPREIESSVGNCGRGLKMEMDRWEYAPLWGCNWALSLYDEKLLPKACGIND